MNTESRRGLAANVDLIISGVAVVAVCSSQTWRTSCFDMLLFFSAIAVYIVLSRHFKVKGRPTRCKDSMDPKENGVEVVEAPATSSNSEVELLAVVEPVGQPQQSEECEQIVKMKQLASARNIAGTMRIFRTFKKEGTRMTSTMYNTVLLAWIKSGNVQAAEDWMEQIVEEGLADLVSFNTLIKTLVKTRALEKACTLLDRMRTLEIEPDIVTFNELIGGCANENSFMQGLSLMEAMHQEGVQPNAFTLDAIVSLLTGCRGHDQSSDRVRRILGKFKLEPNSNGQWSGLSASQPPVAVPSLVAAMTQADKSKHSLCHHEITITGDLPRVKAARRTLKQHGFLDEEEDEEVWPLNGHWETDHGLTVVVEGKLVRWSRQRASRLQFSAPDRRSCVLTLYGVPSQGRLVTPGTAPGATKTLSWANGDVWHSYDGRVIGQAALFSQTMTKVLRDSVQDQAYSGRSEMVLRTISHNGLCMPSTIENAVLQFLGNDLYFVKVSFASKWNPQWTDENDVDGDPFDSMSRRNPRVGFRHCWAEPGKGCYGQRTLANGEDVDEECFNRHVKILWKK